MTVIRRVAGVHVLAQIDTPTISPALATQIHEALAVPGVVAFGVRVPWTTIDTTFAVLDQAKAIAGGAGKELSVRYMAGRHVPARVQGACAMLGTGTNRYPRPFDRDGQLNVCFLDETRSLVERLAAWARANDVPLLHLSHYAHLWAEFFWGPDVQAIRGGGAAGQAAMVAATVALVDIGVGVAGSDLAVELPMSGHGPLMATSVAGPPGIAERVAEYIAAAGVPFFVQGNGWDEDGIWGAGSQDVETRFDRVLGYGALLGVQMIQPGNLYDWRRVFAVATAKAATYCEVYLPSFTGGTSAGLREEVAVWAPYLPAVLPPPVDPRDETIVVLRADVARLRDAIAAAAAVLADV